MIPAIWKSVPDWMRMVAVAVNPLLQGYPFMELEADPASPRRGFTYFNTTSGKVRTWNGSMWKDHYT